MTDRITMENHRRNHEGGWQLFQDPALRDSWGDCKKRAMVPDISAPYLCGEQEFFSIKENTKKLYAYSNRLINSIYHWSVRPLAYVMVDGHGFILKLYCGEEIRGWLEERGIRERCSLAEEHAGTTAFSLGIKYKRPFRTTGSEHYLSKFIDMTMYFAPCVLEDNSRERFGELELLGGIGIITPRTDRFEDYLATVITMCKEVCLHLDMVNTFYNFYMSETMGYICVDIDERTRRPYCLYHNSNIFNVLGIPFSDLCFKSLSTVFDPLPANREFWQVLSSNEYLHNASISLSIQGVTRQYIVSTMPYRQVSVGYEGMRFFYFQQGAGQFLCLPANRQQRHYDFREHHWAEPRDQAIYPICPEICRVRQQCPHHGRERSGQGHLCPGDPQCQFPQGPPLYRGELRHFPSGFDGERALRIRAGGRSPAPRKTGIPANWSWPTPAPCF